ncbi:MAG: DUF2177 family protein [Notoacmeibacter sp.]
MRPIGLTGWIIASFTTALILLAADTFVIPNIMRPLFKHYLGDHMLDELRLIPAALFYLIHIGGLVYLAVRPALLIGTSKTALANGFVLGFVAYSCYEMTSWTIMTNWHLNLVVIDTAWGAFISALAAYFGALAGIKWSLRA